MKLKIHNTLKFTLTVLFLVMLSACKEQGNISIKLKNAKAAASTGVLNVTISNIQVVNHQVVITGTNLNTVSAFKIKEGTNISNLAIESSTSTTIIANTLSNVTFAAGKILDFVFSNANAAATYTVNFSLCDSSLGGKAFDCLTAPMDKQVLSYDQVSGKWKPRDVNGLNYIGAYDASSGATPAIQAAGQYYIISVAGDIYTGSVTLNLGDWIVSNGTIWQKIDNSTVITSVFGRTGAVTASLSDLTDIDFSPAPTVNQYLKYDGTNWAPATLTYTETDPSVTAFAKAALPTCTAGQVLKSNGTAFSCVTDATGAGAFTGTANRAVVTDGAGALAVSAITDTVLGYLSGATSNIQTQIDSKLASASFVNWQIAGAQTLEPTRLNLTTANRVVITNGTSTPIASTVTTTELGYLSGVTSAIQTQLNAKLSSYTETDPGVTAFAKAALPTCNAGEVLKANGTSLSCVTDVTGAGAYTGTINKVVLTDGTTGALTTSAVTNTEVGYVAGVTSAIQTQLNAKQASITSATALVTGSVQTNLQGGVQVNPFNTAAGNTGEARFYELAAGGTNYTGFKAPDALAADLIYVLPVTAPTAGQVLSSDATGILSWIAIPSAPVSTVFGRTGAVVATAGDYTATQITNTAAGNIAATTAQAAINELDTEKQSIASFAADVRAVVLTGISFATSTAITAADSILVAFGKLQGQITTLDAVDSNKLNKNTADSITAIVTVSGAGDLIIPSVPAGMTSAVNKTYADGKLALTGGTMTGPLVNNTSSASTVLGITQSGAGYAATFMGGNVGVGTVTPAATLDVDGGVSVKSSYELGVAYVNSTATYTIPDALANIRRITLTANSTITLPAFTTPTTRVYTLTLFLKQDATGSRTVTFAGNGADTILWDANTAPTIAAGIGKISILQFTKASDETVWYASQVWKGE